MTRVYGFYFIKFFFLDSPIQPRDSDINKSLFIRHLNELKRTWFKIYSKFIIRATGGINKFSKLPKLYLINIYSLKDSIENHLYTAPLTVVDCRDDCSFLMVRYINKKHSSSEKIYEPIFFRAIPWNPRFYGVISYITETKKFSGRFLGPATIKHRVKQSGKDYLQRLIQGKPCGDMTQYADEASPEVEGWRVCDKLIEGPLPEDGSSVVYLA